MKCRWCDYTVPAVLATSRPSDGVDWLKAHARRHHPREFREFARKRYHHNAARYDERRREE